MKKWKPYVIGAALTLAVGALSGLLSAGGMLAYTENAAKPPLSPPGWVFSVVWSLLYILMGVGATGIFLAPEGRERSRGLNLFVLQLAVNFFWSLLFFNAKAYGFSLLWLMLLWGLVLLMILSFRKVDKKAAILQIPYLLWLTFAAYLNFGVWRLN